MALVAGAVSQRAVPLHGALWREREHACALDSPLGRVFMFDILGIALLAPFDERGPFRALASCAVFAGGGRGGGRGFGGRGGFNRAPEGPPDRE